MKKSYLLGMGIIIIIIIGVGGGLSYYFFRKGNNEENNPLYLTIVLHTEEDKDKNGLSKANIPDYDGNETLLLHFTSVMRNFAEMVAEHNAKINFGTDWTFADGVRNFDPNFFTDLEELGHEIDTHAHESHISYNEVRQRIIQAGGSPTKVASGLLEAAIYHKMNTFQTDNNFRILWGVALPGHSAGEAIPGWTWRPSSDNWTIHDSESEFIYIGPGDMVNNVSYIENAIYNRNYKRINTYAVFCSPREFKAATDTPGIPEKWTADINSSNYWVNKMKWWNEFLTELDNLNNLEYATLTDIGSVFTQQETSLDYSWTTIPRSELSLLERNELAGYPGIE
jgi:hypothetical protein